MKELSFFQTCGKYGTVKLAINGELPESLSDEFISDILYGVLSSINDKIQEKMMSDDQALLSQLKRESEELKSLFGSEIIYVRYIENQYLNYGYFKLRKWLEVTTRLGVIIVGWRKRVIEIDWSKSDIKEKAETLFHNEDVTYGDYYIHAWGLAKAKEYIGILLKQ